MSPIFLENVNLSSDDETLNKEYKVCIERYPCKHDNKPFTEIPEDEQHEVYHCRVSRHLKCSMPEEE